MLTFVLPTRDRPQRLKATLLALEELDLRDCAGEVIVVDNASRERAILPQRLGNGLLVRTIHLPKNEGAAARNHGVRQAQGQWVVMLDDDSYPLDAEFVRVLRAQPADVAAVSADIWLSPRRRESGGLPEVFIGCGVAIRTRDYLDSGGYDPSFNYYAEEYDLSAKLLLAGKRVVFSRAFRVMHAKEQRQRDMGVILARLVRNSGWVAQRYAPPERRAQELREVRRRYRAIAAREDALPGFARGLLELRRTLRQQRRRPLSPELFDRFSGLAAAREALGEACRSHRVRTVWPVDQGKNAWVVGAALRELGVRVVGDGEAADAQVIATMSPGPMLDAYASRLSHARGRGPVVLAPWLEAVKPGLGSAPPKLAGGEREAA